MWFKRDGEWPAADEVIDLTERLAPYEGEGTTVAAWRNGLKAADRERSRAFRAHRSGVAPGAHFRAPR